MGSIYQRGGQLWGYYRLAGGKRSKSFATGFPVGQETKARDLIVELERQAAEGQAIEVRRPVPRVGAVLTVAAFGEQFVDERQARGVMSVNHERNHLRYLGELADRPLADLKKAEALAWARSLASRTGERGRRLSPATVQKITSTVKMLFKEAVKRDLLAVSPAVWDANDLPRKLTAARSRTGGYTAEDVARFVYDERIAEDRRVLYALEFLTGMRTGEAAVRRWRDWEPEFQGDLGRLVCATAWNTEHLVEKATKTEIEKWLPVHPALREILTAWKREGWAKYWGRTPGPDDLIVPSTENGVRSNRASWAAWARDLERLGMPHQRHYESRSTFRSLALAGGAARDDVDLLTHPSPRSASDVYTRVGVIWPRLCRAVRAIALDRPAAEREPLRLVAESAGQGPITPPANHAKSGQSYSRELQAGLTTRNHSLGEGRTAPPAVLLSRTRIRSGGATVPSRRVAPRGRAGALPPRARAPSRPRRSRRGRRGGIRRPRPPPPPCAAGSPFACRRGASAR